MISLLYLAYRSLSGHFELICSASIWLVQDELNISW